MSFFGWLYSSLFSEKSAMTKAKERVAVHGKTFKDLNRAVGELEIDISGKNVDVRPEGTVNGKH